MLSLMLELKSSDSLGSSRQSEKWRPAIFFYDDTFAIVKVLAIKGSFLTVMGDKAFKVVDLLKVFKPSFSGLASIEVNL